MPVQKRFARLGVAKQTAKGSPAASPDYAFGVSGGNILTTEVEDEELPTTWNDRLLSGHDRKGITPGASCEAVAHAGSLGLLLYAALGTIDTTGAGPYAHAITPGNSLPYLTLFTESGSEYHTVEDARVGTLGLAWDRTGALTVSPSFMAAGLSLDTGSFTAGTEEVVADGVFKGHGQTFEIDGAAATVESGSVTIENNLEALFGSDDVLPADVFPGTVGISASLTVIPEDFSLWQKVLTGQASGGTIGASPYYGGTTTLTFAVDANTDLVIALNRMHVMTPYPDNDPAGGAQRIEVEGVIARPTSGDACSFTLNNNETSY